MSDFDVLGYAASGMRAEHQALDIAARNVALAQTASAAHPVHPLAPVFTQLAATFAGDDVRFFAEPCFGDDRADGDGDDDDGPQPMTVDPATLPGALDVVGTKPRGAAVSGIDAITEMVGVLDAQRGYEFNASVFDAGKKLIERTLQVGQ